MAGPSRSSEVREGHAMRLVTAVGGWMGTRPVSTSYQRRPAAMHFRCSSGSATPSTHPDRSTGTGRANSMMGATAGIRRCTLVASHHVTLPHIRRAWDSTLTELSGKEGSGRGDGQWKMRIGVLHDVVPIIMLKAHRRLFMLAVELSDRTVTVRSRLRAGDDEGVARGWHFGVCSCPSSRTLIGGTGNCRVQLCR
ncbi:hypothetical protein BV20DRAFT_971852 [Pilatotrama ljubarskyi]|nr:hypothetical protein BV20DRAFT_971852 [Pilatotrama ljubarskyi]